MTAEAARAATAVANPGRQGPGPAIDVTAVSKTCRGRTGAVEALGEHVERDHVNSRVWRRVEARARIAGLDQVRALVAHAAWHCSLRRGRRCARRPDHRASPLQMPNVSDRSLALTCICVADSNE